MSATTPGDRPRPSFLEQLLHSRLLRVLLLGFLSLLLMIPLGSIRDVIAERQQTRDAAKTELATQWGGPQTLAGPFLVLPYNEHHVEKKDGKDVAVTTTSRVVLLPETLDIDATQNTEERRRGLFMLPVYRAQATITGHFAHPDLGGIGVAQADVQWQDAEIVLMLSDLRALTGAVQVQIGDQSLPFQPGGGSLLTGMTEYSFGRDHPEIEGCCGALGREHKGGVIHARWTGLDASAPTLPFSLPLSFNGSDALRLAPVGRVTKVHLRGDWPSPSFDGATLPRTREVANAGTGFTADWEIPDLSRSYGQLWRDSDIPYPALGASSFGLRLFPAVDQYFMAHRAVKYAQLFVVLTFALYWLFELVGGVRLNPLQYLLVGAGLTTFYLLQLALSEHLGFPLAYLIASVAVTVQITLYSWAALHKLWRALGIGAAMGGLYAYLYSALQEENYALLSGAVAVFVMLSLIMWLTRRVDWSARPATA